MSNGIGDVTRTMWKWGGGGHVILKNIACAIECVVSSKQIVEN